MNFSKAEFVGGLRETLKHVYQDCEGRFSVWLAKEVADARFYYIRFRAENGDALNQYRFGLMFETGERGLQSAYEAHKWFLRAAFQGLVEAQAKVSEYHLTGKGVARNEEEAFCWCRKAAELGHAPSQAQLARMYAEGIGVERNPREARKWVNKAATQRIPFAQAVQQELSAC